MRLLAAIGLAVGLVVLGAGCRSEGVEEVRTATSSVPTSDCPARPRPVPPAPGSGHRDYFPPYKSLDDLTGASDVVVLAEVTETARGEISGAQPGHGGFRAMAVTLKVRETYRGTGASDEIVFIESGWSVGPPERATTESGVHRSQAGECGFYFLTRDPEADTFSLTSIQGKFIAEGEDGLFAGFERSDALSDELGAMSFTEFRRAVQAAAERMEGVSPSDVKCRQHPPRPVECGEPADRAGEE